MQHGQLFEQPTLMQHVGVIWRKENDLVYSFELHWAAATLLCKNNKVIYTYAHSAYQTESVLC